MNAFDFCNSMSYFCLHNDCKVTYSMPKMVMEYKKYPTKIVKSHYFVSGCAISNDFNKKECIISRFSGLTVNVICQLNYVLHPTFKTLNQIIKKINICKNF